MLATSTTQKFNSRQSGKVTLCTVHKGINITFALVSPFVHSKKPTKPLQFSPSYLSLDIEQWFSWNQNWRTHREGLISKTTCNKGILELLTATTWESFFQGQFKRSNWFIERSQHTVSSKELSLWLFDEREFSHQPATISGFSSYWHSICQQNARCDVSGTCGIPGAGHETQKWQGKTDLNFILSTTLDILDSQRLCPLLTLCQRQIPAYESPKGWTDKLDKSKLKAPLHWALPYQEGIR